MGRRLDCVLAERRGSRIAAQQGCDAFRIDPRRVAMAKRIRVDSRDLEGCSGCLVRRAGTFGILHSSRAANEGAARFTIAHELGQYFLDGHAEALFADGDGIHRSQSGFVSRDPREMEADHFAVGMLLPEQLFRAQLSRVDPGFEGLEGLVEVCGTSLTATAIRYANLTDDPVALVVSSERSVEVAVLSEPLRGWRDIEWPAKGQPIPSGTGTARLNADKGAVKRAERRSADSCFSDWFEGAPDLDCIEETVRLGRFGRTLTLLWSEEPIPEEDEESDDDL